MKYLLIALLTSLSGTSHALTSDQNQPLEITSESAELRQQSGYAVYTGSVRLTQASLQIYSDKIELYFKDKKFHEAIISGKKPKQAYFQQTPTKGEAPVRGKADRIVYAGDDDEIRLLGDAAFCQKGSEQKGKRIIYDMKSDIMKAKARTRTVFRPDSAPGNCDHIQSDYR